MNISRLLSTKTKTPALRYDRRKEFTIKDLCVVPLLLHLRRVSYKIS